ncbi:MAG: tRNA (adenosine(37)-N6)-threonylcarbamoyltransferase complex dimerization subunit type 1 TsaB [Spirochaetia bacterium]|jgi:tRNA threonylcarbamoyladenosine biosynthesis protein TsaB|nr:tRNA (adenosine(37)-N6)-threonylcarbamoyltransferase complex dimerization subunit type 1 TsaB [Spirochaetia bacterium]
MNVLSFDTSTGIFSICLKTDQNRYEFSCDMGFKHSETLVNEIDLFLKREDISISDLDLIVCPSGPGSFTGLRIGMATAKGLSLGSGVPMVTVPTMDMISYGFNYFEGIVVPIIDARKKRFYTAIYSKGEKLSDNLDLTPEDILTILKKYDRTLLTGPDVLEFSKYIEINPNIYIDNLQIKSWAGNLITLGIEQYQKFGASSDSEGPLYLRRSEAEIGITRKP